MQILELLLEVVGICLGQKGHFWVFLPTGEHPVQLKGRRQFFASIQNAFGFCQPVIPDITSTTAQLAQALRLLFGRFESEFVGFQNLYLALSV